MLILVISPDLIISMGTSYSTYLQFLIKSKYFHLLSWRKEAEASALLLVSK